MNRLTKRVIDRRVAREAKLLVGEVRRGLKKDREISEALGTKMVRVADSLAAARQIGDQDTMRARLFELEKLADEQLPGARKSTLREYAESIGIAVLVALFLRAFVVEAFKIPSSSMVPNLEIGDHIFVNKFLYGIRIPYTNTKFFEFRHPRRGEIIVFRYPCNQDKDFIKRVVAVAGDTVEVRCDVLYVNGKPVQREFKDHVTYWDHEDGRPWSLKVAAEYLESHNGQTYRTFFETDGPVPDRGDDHDDHRGYFNDNDFPRRVTPFSREEALARRRTAIRRGAYEDFCQGIPELRAAALGQFASSPPGEAGGQCAPRLHYVVPQGHTFVMGDNRLNSKDSRIWGPVPLKYVKGKALFVWWSRKSAEADGIAWHRIGKIVH